MGPCCGIPGWPIGPMPIGGPGGPIILGGLKGPGPIAPIGPGPEGP